MSPMTSFMILTLALVAGQIIISALFAFVGYIYADDGREDDGVWDAVVASLFVTPTILAVSFILIHAWPLVLGAAVLYAIYYAVEKLLWEHIEAFAKKLRTYVQKIKKSYRRTK